MKGRGQGGPGNGWKPCVKWLSATTRRWCLGLALFGPGLVLADDLPPPPTEMSVNADATLYLDLLVNQMPRAELVPVQQRAGRLFIASEVLTAAGISLPGVTQGEVALDAYADLHADYDSANQRLLLQVPAAWLPLQRVGERGLHGGAVERLHARGDPDVDGLLRQRLVAGQGLLQRDYIDSTRDLLEPYLLGLTPVMTGDALHGDTRHHEA